MSLEHGLSATPDKPPVKDQSALAALCTDARVVSALLVSLVCIWVALAAHMNTALHHDMAEQAVWSHAWQWSYPKHPPLPTWLLLLALQVLPPVPGTIYAMSAFCFSVAGVCTYATGRALLGPRGGLCVALLWGLQQPFGWRAWIYNHNTVLVMTVSLAVMCTVFAVQRSGRRWWWAAGVAAGLAMCTKLQAAVPLVGLLLALWASGGLSAPVARWRLGQAIAIALLVCAVPMWDALFGATSVASYAMEQLDSGAHWSFLHRLVHFVVTSLRTLVPALLLVLAWLVSTRGGEMADVVGWPAGRVRRAWLLGLLWWPVFVVVLFGAIGKTMLHTQWSVQTLQFASLAVVMVWGGRFQGLSWRQLLVPALLIQGGALVIAASAGPGHLHAHGAAEGYPSTELARRVQADWDRAAAPCPLSHVAAPFFVGGQLSAYLPSHPAVLEDGDPRQSPWIDLQKMAKAGSVVLTYDLARLPADAWHEPSMQLTPPGNVRGVPTVYWAIVRPQGHCPGPHPG